MNTKDILEYISVPNAQRRNNILDVLKEHSISYDLETLNPNEYTNIILHTPDCINHNMKILVSAHYDAVNKSHGANDNGAAVTVLMKLAEYAKSHTAYCETDIALFDREETGFLGSAGYIKQHKANMKTQPVFFINCDVIGCGDGIVMVKHNNDISYPMPRKAISNDLMSKYEITEYKYFPPSDAFNLSSVARLNGIEISVFPEEDIRNQASTKVFKYMHNREYDDIKFINYDMVDKVYELLKDIIFVK